MQNLIHSRFGALSIGTIAAILVSVALCPQAKAADDVEAVIQQGIEFRRQGRDGDALAAFQRAARIQETPRVLAQIGAAQQALGVWVEANTFLTRALGYQSDDWIKKNRPVLDAALAVVRSHLGHVEVWGGPDGAEVQFDGVTAGKLPLVTTWLGLGDVSMKVTAPGYTPATRPLRIPPDVRVREHVQLRERPSITKAPGPKDDNGQGGASGGPGGGGGAGGTGGAGISDVPPPPTDATAPIYRKWWFWTVMGAIAVGAGTGIYLLTRESASCAMPPCDTI